MATGTGNQSSGKFLFLIFAVNFLLILPLQLEITQTMILFNAWEFCPAEALMVGLVLESHKLNMN